VITNRDYVKLGTLLHEKKSLLDYFNDDACPERRLVDYSHRSQHNNTIALNQMQMIDVKRLLEESSSEPSIRADNKCCSLCVIE
jgi:hypothetical protein